jgi:hypothetical protein
MHACTPATPLSIGNQTVEPRTSELDRLGFIAGCWQEEIARGLDARTYRLCWSREPGRWHGSLTRTRPPESAGMILYFIYKSPEGLVLEYGTREKTERVRASRAEHDAIEFRRPDPPGRRWRGPDLALHYYSPADALWVTFFDESHSFERDR